jgi:hypothetical protein
MTATECKGVVPVAAPTGGNGSTREVRAEIGQATDARWPNFRVRPIVVIQPLNSKGRSQK